jgi:hypothetical protein
MNSIVKAAMEDTSFTRLVTEHVGVPKSEHPTLPKHRMRWLFERALPFIGFGKVDMVPINIDGKDYYRIEAKVPFRTYHATVTYLGAYYLGKAVLMHMVHEKTNVEGLMVQDSDTTPALMGTLFFPRWCLPAVLDQLTYICRKHHPQIKMMVEAIDHEVDVLKNKVKGEPAPQLEHTLH